MGWPALLKMYAIAFATCVVFGLLTGGLGDNYLGGAIGMGIGILVFWAIMRRRYQADAPD